MSCLVVLMHVRWGEGGEGGIFTFSSPICSSSHTYASSANVFHICVSVCLSVCLSTSALITCAILHHTLLLLVLVYVTKSTIVGGLVLCCLDGEKKSGRQLQQSCLCKL